ncbi:MAG: sulfate ABC transporter substrate-binding protein [Acidobacteria bacterium]|nr:sulfate ABC transporter substrate-binding protein [Acidobacteriota bacterium]
MKTYLMNFGCWTLFFLVICLQACARQENKANKVTLILGSYTAPREVYGKAILPMFKDYWKKRTGQDVQFQTSYQGSGAQARAVVGGFEADVAALALAEDIDRIAEAGLITHDWKADSHGGMVSRSIVVIAVRRGNPKGIRDWPDLALPGLNILTPDPKTSGGAMWNINAIYGAALRGFAGVAGGDAAAARGFLKSVFRNVSVMDKGARESLTTYEKGIGDVAITYENEVLIGRAAGQPYEYVIPRSTLLIENPAAVVDKYADKHGSRDVAEAFVDFLSHEEAQRAYAKYGLRPVNPEVARETESQFPPVDDLWKIDFLGGWKKVISELYGPQGMFTQVQRELQASK